MRKPLNTVLFALGLIGSISVVGQTSTRAVETTTISPVDKDSLLKATWNLFASSVENKDLNLFKSLSTKCIRCDWCVTNTQTEDSLFNLFRANNESTWYDRLYKDFSLIPIDKFINEDFTIIFSDTVISGMRDASKHFFVDNNHNLQVYDNACILAGMKDLKPDLREVLLTVVESTLDYEGFQFAFAFLEIDGQYKFCGFSTIP